MTYYNCIDKSTKTDVIVEYDGIEYFIEKKNKTSFITLKPLTKNAREANGIENTIEDRWRNAFEGRIGQVLSVGEACFPEKFFTAGAVCEVGDWVLYQRHAIQITTLYDPREEIPDGDSQKDFIFGHIADSAIVGNLGKNINPFKYDTKSHHGK